MNVKAIVDRYLRKKDTESMENMVIVREIPARENPLHITQFPKRSSRLWGVVIASIIVFVFPIVGALALNYGSMKQSEELLSPLSPSETQYLPAIQASTDQLQADETQFEYELSLAERFLTKAVQLSNQSKQQTVEEQNQIIFLLNQALESANKAVTIKNTDPRGYSSRGRIYQAISVVKPEVKPLADKDFADAERLGSNAPTSAPTTEDPLNLLPTKQAENAGAKAVIAGPETVDSSTVSGQEGQNTSKGTATLNAGEREVFVPYPSVHDTTQLYVVAQDNPENITFYVKNKEAGKGFTVGATASPSAPLRVTWWEVK